MLVQHGELEAKELPDTPRAALGVQDALTRQSLIVGKQRVGEMGRRARIEGAGESEAVGLEAEYLGRSELGVGRDRWSTAPGSRQSSSPSRSTYSPLEAFSAAVQFSVTEIGSELADDPQPGIPAKAPSTSWVSSSLALSETTSSKSSSSVESTEPMQSPR